MSDRLPRPEPRDAFRRALRARLMAQAPGLLIRRETAWSRFRGGLRGPALRPALVAAAIVLLIGASAGRAAADSLSGDVAFTLKVAAEQIQLAFALDDTTRLRLLSEQADHRLAELAEAVSARPNSATAAQDAYAKAVQTLTVAVDTLRAQPTVSEDKKNAAEDVVDAAHQKHEALLDDLENKVSPGEQPEIDRAREESDKLHPSGRPALTPTPANEPERTRTPQPARTGQPERTDGEHQGTPTKSPQPRLATATPRGEGSLPPGPADRR